MAKLLRHLGIKKATKTTIIDDNNEDHQQSSSNSIQGTMFFTSTEFVCMTTSSTKKPKNSLVLGGEHQLQSSVASTTNNINNNNNDNGDHLTVNEEEGFEGGGAWPPRATSSPAAADEATAQTWEQPPHKHLSARLPSSPLCVPEQIDIFEDYSDPFDLKTFAEEQTVDDDDYTEPDDAFFVTKISSNESHVENDGSETLEVADDLLEGDYDCPWEWLPSAQVNCVLGENPDLIPTDAVVVVDNPDCTMTGRQRHIYETAFDSTVKHAKIPAELEEIANHPILRNDSPLVTPKTTPKMPVRAVTNRDMPVPDQSTPKERRKVTLIRDGFRHSSQKDSLFSLPSDNYKDRHGFRTEQVKALVHAPPRSANSTPLISHRFRHIDSAASSAKSTPTHYTSTAKVSVEVPVKPLSDLSLSSKSSKVAGFSGFQTLPHLPSRSAVSPRVRKPVRTEMVKSISSEETLLSNVALKPFNCKDPPEPAQTELSSLSLDSNKSSEKDSDPRPADDYDPPWEFTKKKRILPFSFSLDSAQMISNISNNELSSNSNSTGDVNSDQSAKESGSLNMNSKPRLSLSLPLKPNDSSVDNSSSNKKNLALNFGGQSQKKKIGLQLNFGCAALSVVGEKVDPAIPLERQGWYHGSISRTDAENVLRVLKEGSYLTRNSESNKQDYSLSLKSARGFMHMKIVNLEGKYILGQFSKPFNNIPEMIHHYSINKLPIKGAEHMSLLYPVIDQLL